MTARKRTSAPSIKRWTRLSERADVIIDFSISASTAEIVRFALERKIPAVIGTTGLGERELKLIRSASDQVAMFQTGNMSLGVNRQSNWYNSPLPRSGPNFDVEIIETHHRKKVDSPSGTALMLANAVSSISPEDEESVFGRMRKTDAVPITKSASIWSAGGTVVGEHQVQFIGNDEIIEISHRAFSKQVAGGRRFARGEVPG